MITTVAGGGSCRDDCTAISANLYPVYSVAVDAANNLYIANTIDNRIVKVNAAQA